MADRTQAISSQPETYYLPPTEYVPNSPMPVLVYRNVLPMPHSKESSQEMLEGNGWTRVGKVWGAYYTRHFHPTNHEVYAVFSGSSEVLMGVGVSDEVDLEKPDSETSGVRFTLSAGDVIVHPAGTSHANLTSHGDYKYIALYPNVNTTWRTELGKSPVDLDTMRNITLAVPIPEDPVYGGEGILQPLWKAAMERFHAANSN